MKPADDSDTGMVTQLALQPPAATLLPATTADLIGRIIVLDTSGPILYFGTLRDLRPDGFWLDQADVHDCRDGHAGKELYICETRRDGVHVNRKSVFVYRDAVMSVSRLEDIIVD